MTLPTIRDNFAECYEGTAIVEEADRTWGEMGTAFESLLSDRYQRHSAEASLKVKRSEHSAWTTTTRKNFGATVVHRRFPFADAALDGRSVFIRFRADHTRQYRDFGQIKNDPCITEGSELARNLEIKPCPVEQPAGVAARVFATYQPILSVATLCGDHAFLAKMKDRLLLETGHLKEAQSAEPDGLIVRAILDQVNMSGGYAYIRVGLIVDTISRNHKLWLDPRQVAGMARELGFATKNSHGVTVIVPTPVTLLRACEQAGYEDDEAVIELKAEILGNG